MTDRYWYAKSYRRILADMHIEDWDERFLSQLNPLGYVELLKKSKAKSAMVYANSHVGYCYWPTKTGRMHRGIKGRDVLGEIIGLCHREGMEVTVYYSLLYNNWAYEQHPEWRIVDVEGKTSREKPGRSGRYGVCCPNSPGYRSFVQGQIEELCQSYSFEGIFFDMTFWLGVCYCANCRRRYREETGKDPPMIIDWDDPSWVRFQTKREEWLAEFAAFATSTVKRHKPETAVEHQSSTTVAPWTYGASHLLADHCDYVAGDFYGDALQQSFICKLFYNLTPNMPFEFHTSICYPGLADHTTTKPRELLERRVFLTLAHNGAFLMIDAVDPVGTFDEGRYSMIGEIYKEVSGYEKYLGGQLCQDIAVYFSFDSKMDFAYKGRKPEEWGVKLPHLEAALGAAQALRTNHIPFGIITRKNLKDLAHYRVVILPNVLRLSDEEADAVREYVAVGGSVYASKFTLKSKLREMLNANFMGETAEKFTYVAPTSEGKWLLPGITEEHPLSIPDSQVKAGFSSKEGVMATITLPYTDPEDPSKFASIHSNPPGPRTEQPALVLQKYGRGRVIWSSASIEANAVQSLKHRTVFANIIRSLVQEPLSFEASAPGCVEIIQFHKPEEKAYVISLVNSQSDVGEPSIPVHDIPMKVKVRGKALKTILCPEETPIPFTQDGDFVNLTVPILHTYCMLVLKYE